MAFAVSFRGVYNYIAYTSDTYSRCCLLFQNDLWCVHSYWLDDMLDTWRIDQLINRDKPVYWIVWSWELKRQHAEKDVGKPWENHCQKGSKGDLLQVFCIQPSEWERWIPSNWHIEVGIEQKRLRSQTNPVLLSCQFLCLFLCFLCFDCFNFI